MEMVSASRVLDAGGVREVSASRVLDAGSVRELIADLDPTFTALE